MPKKDKEQSTEQSRPRRKAKHLILVLAAICFSILFVIALGFALKGGSLTHVFWSWVAVFIFAALGIAFYVQAYVIEPREAAKPEAAKEEHEEAAKPEAAKEKHEIKNVAILTASISPEAGRTAIAPSLQDMEDSLRAAGTYTAIYKFILDAEGPGLLSQFEAILEKERPSFLLFVYVGPSSIGSSSRKKSHLTRKNEALLLDHSQIELGTLITAADQRTSDWHRSSQRRYRKEEDTALYVVSHASDVDEGRLADCMFDTLGLFEVGSRRRRSFVLAAPTSPGREVIQQRKPTIGLLEVLAEAFSTGAADLDGDGAITVRDLVEFIPGGRLFGMRVTLEANDYCEVMETEFLLEEGQDISIGYPHTSERVTHEAGAERLPDPIILNSPTLETDARGGMYRVWYGTNRKMIEDFENVSVSYLAERETDDYYGMLIGGIHFGVCYVYVPKTHKIGSIGSPWWRRLLTMRDDSIKLSKIMKMGDAFWDRLRNYTSGLPVDSRTGVVFLHGYNVSFEEAAIRAAQIGYDLQVRGPMAFFSWPSQGGVDGYMADEASIEASERQITDFLCSFAERSGCSVVHVIAHSMGNRGLLRAIHRIIGAGQSKPAIRFGHLILAAPDIDRGVFKDLAAGYGEMAKHTTLYVSDHDRALQASGYLHKYPRVGMSPPITVVPGIDTIHVGEVDLSFLGHGYVAAARPVLYDMHSLLFQDLPPDRRMGLRPCDIDGQQCYWRISS